MGTRRIRLFGTRFDKRMSVSAPRSCRSSNNNPLQRSQTVNPRLVDSHNAAANGALFVLVTVIEDYVRLLLQIVDFAPDILFPSPAFPASFGAAIAGLTLVQVEICYVALEFLRIVLTHDALLPPTSGVEGTPAVVPPKFPIYAQAIRDVVVKQGFQLLGCLLTGFVGDFDEDTTSQVVTIFRAMSGTFPAEMGAWLPAVVEQLSSSIPASVKEQFMGDYNK